MIQSEDKQAEEFRAYIEKEVLQLIKELVIKGGIEEKRIQLMAREVLNLLQPGMNLDELYANAIKIDDNFSELCPIVIKLMRAYEDRFHKKAVAEVSTLIKEGNYDAAQDMVMKVLKYKGV